MVSLVLLLLGTFFTAGCLVEIEYLPTKTALPKVTNPEDPRVVTAQSPTPTPSPLPTHTLTPTPTRTLEPVTFSVGENDDMFSIALFYGISLEALKTANPDVNPNAMSLGTVLQIPLTPTAMPSPDPSQPAAQTTPEAYELSLSSEPACYADALGGAGCLVLLTNEGEETVENASVGFRLTNTEENYQAEMLVFSLLNLLPPGDTLPVYAYFSAPVPEELQVEAWVESWLPTMPDDVRYAAVVIGEEQISYEKDKKSAQIRGELSIAAEEKELASVWLLAVAYQSTGKPLGLRRWEANPQQLTNPSEILFEISLYSMSGPIDSIELFAEARYQNP